MSCPSLHHLHSNDDNIWHVYVLQCNGIIAPYHDDFDVTVVYRGGFTTGDFVLRIGKIVDFSKL